MKIGIIAAMDVEVELLKKSMINRKEVVHSNGVYFVGEIGKHDVILRQCGIGKVSAALDTQKMIDAFKVDLIINTGCGGGIAKGLGIGDIVLSTKTVEWDMDTVALGDPRGYIQSVDSIEMEATEKLNQIIKAIIPSNIKVHEGLVASGDQFVCKDNQRKEILHYFPSTLCVEMEGGAVGHVCYQNKVPFTVIRCLSDSADSTSHVDYFTFKKSASELSASLVIKFLNQDITL